MKHLRHFIKLKRDKYSHNDIGKVMCPQCGMKVNTNNYCEVCDCVLGDRQSVN